jgi:formylglycine-generating enzyme required for sulfatase activity
MDAATTVHPTDQDLLAYRAGKLEDAQSESMSRHLEDCSACQTRIAGFLSDDLPGQFRDDQELHAMSAATRSQSGGSSSDSGPAVAVEPPAADASFPGLAEHPDYELIRELGRGGMGVVYLVRNKLMGRLEVHKVVGGHAAERPGARNRFLREVQSAGKLQHENIVAAYSAMRLDQSVVLAMEYIEGDDLAEVVNAGGPLPVTNACYVVYQAALGLQHAHERGMVHRDIKPANLILARMGEKDVVKILDFGLAKVTSDGQVDSSLTREGQTLGTPDFIAPEQIRDAQSADIRADIYSLGCTFYFLLTGGPPFRGEHVWDLYQAHLSMEAGPLNLVRPEVPVELAALVAKMMAKEPRKRFHTPGEVAQALVPFFETEKGNVAVKTANPRQNLGRWSTAVEKLSRSGSRARSAAAALVLFGLVLAFAAMVFRSKSTHGMIVRENAPENAAVPVDRDRSTVIPVSQGSFRNSIGMTFEPIPAGEFLMGSFDSEKGAYPNEKPQHLVRITKPFYLCESEVTQAQYEVVMGNNPSFLSANGGGKALVAEQPTDQHPVENVSWLEAILFCNKLSEKERRKPFYEIDGEDIRVVEWNGPGYRLPTEAEWEFACRANTATSTRYSFGNDVPKLGEYAWFDANSDYRTHPVRQKRPNGFGLYDMHGNVWEWCWDWYGEGYGKSPVGDDPIGPGAALHRILRGGAYDSESHRTRSAARLRIAPELRYEFLGFRLAVNRSG